MSIELDRDRVSVRVLVMNIVIDVQRTLTSLKYKNSRLGKIGAFMNGHVYTYKWYELKCKVGR